MKSLVLMILIALDRLALWWVGPGAAVVFGSAGQAGSIKTLVPMAATIVPSSGKRPSLAGKFDEVIPSRIARLIRRERIGVLSKSSSVSAEDRRSFARLKHLRDPYGLPIAYDPSASWRRVLLRRQLEQL